MIEGSIFLAVLGGILLLLFLILRVKLPAFLALLLASLSIGVFSGLSPAVLVETLEKGMGSTLGFVAIVVGLGALLGGLLEHSGGATALATALLRVFGEKKAAWALACTGFILAIPIFFDVAFILLVPLVYSLQRKTGRSLLQYALPLLASLAVTHAFIPPTPGPVAVADILSAPMGWVIAFGVVVGLPTAMVSGPVFGQWIAHRLHIEAPATTAFSPTETATAPLKEIVWIIALPLVLIVLKTVLTATALLSQLPTFVGYTLQLSGHPFGALLAANLLAWQWLGVRKKIKVKILNDIAVRSMAPAGLIILLTGAGGTFKQMLITTRAGQMLAETLMAQGIPLLLFAFLAAVLIRLLQGSATVAMITAAGLTAPLITPDFSDPQRALFVLAIAAGASILSHVNDTGFWLVSKYLGMDEKQTFRSWSISTLLIALVGFSWVCVLWLLV